MKYILSILVLALVCAATPVSAALTYEIVRQSFAGEGVPIANNEQHYYKIVITGGSGDLYLSEWIENTNSSANIDEFRKKGVVEYGYRLLNESSTSEREGYWTMGDNGTATIGTIESVPFQPDPYYSYTVTRHSYYLGNFTAGDEVEIYMKDNNGKEAWSWSPETAYHGMYGADNYDRLTAYGIQGFSYDSYTSETVSAAKQAMPLAELDVGDGAVFFGIYPPSVNDEPFGSPLPGGLPTALTCGIFALGFWYVRRKKAFAA